MLTPRTILIDCGAKTAMVDEGDFAIVRHYKWYAVLSRHVWYAVSCVKTERGWRLVRMHRLIMGLAIGDPRSVDHIDRDGMDNRRSNLRIADARLQANNRRLRADNASGFPGVHRRPNGTWQARAIVDGKRVSLGHYCSAEEASRARSSV